MADLSEESFLSLISAVHGVSSGDSTSVKSLFDAVMKGEIRDILEPRHLPHIIKLMHILFSDNNGNIRDHSTVQQLYISIVVLLSFPESQDIEDSLRSAVEQILTEEFFTNIMRRMVEASERYLNTLPQTRESMALVTYAIGSKPLKETPPVPVVPKAFRGDQRLLMNFYEVFWIRGILLYFLSVFPSSKRIIFSLIMTFFDRFGSNPSKDAAVAIKNCLQLILSQLRGEAREKQYNLSHPSSSPVEPAFHLSEIVSGRGLLQALWPLHIDGQLEDLSSALGTYHEQLVLLMLHLCSENTQYVEVCVSNILRLSVSASTTLLQLHALQEFVKFSERSVRAANTPSAPSLESSPLADVTSESVGIPRKQAVSTDFGGPKPLISAPLMAQLASRVLLAAGSDDSRGSQLGLGFFRIRSFVEFLDSHPTASRSAVELLCTGKPHWNSTVNRMAAGALREVMKMLDSNEITTTTRTDKRHIYEPRGFLRAAMDSLLRGAPRTENFPSSSTTNSTTSSSRPLLPSGSDMPPPSVRGLASTSIFTGLSPATRTPNASPLFSTAQNAHVSGQAGSTRGNPMLGGIGASMMKNPPSTVTGVAPWAVSPNSSPRSSLSHASSNTNNASSEEQSSQPQPSSIEELVRGRLTLLESVTSSAFRDDQAEHRNESYATAYGVLSEMKPLSTNLAFQDLVFEKELGRGTFSNVRRALVIDREKPMALWRPLAVKTISRDLILQMGYSLPARRELRVLSLLRHPSCTRLLSAFYFRNDVHLLLELADGGDLHGILAASGSLDLRAIRLLAAMAATALQHVHAQGLAYGDLKPENIVLVKSDFLFPSRVRANQKDINQALGITLGAADAVNDPFSDRRFHLKLTDFAACRPTNELGENNLKGFQKSFQQLRDGSWRAQLGLEMDAADKQALLDLQAKEESIAPAADQAGSSENEDESDERVEGTEAYLPPEARNGSSRYSPSVAGDSYALGVTLLQLASGSLPDEYLLHSAAITHEGSIDSGVSAPADLQQKPGHVRFGNASEISTIDQLFQFFGSRFSYRELFDRNLSSAAGSTLREPPISTGAADNDSESDIDMRDFADLVLRLCHPDPAHRLSLSNILSHPFFASLKRLVDAVAGGSWDALYKLPGIPLEPGSVAPPPDPQWARRHNSSIWAPLPKAYNVDTEVGNVQKGKSSRNRRWRDASSYSLQELVLLDDSGIPLLAVR